MSTGVSVSFCLPSQLPTGLGVGSASTFATIGSASGGPFAVRCGARVCPTDESYSARSSRIAMAHWADALKVLLLRALLGHELPLGGLQHLRPAALAPSGTRGIQPGLGALADQVAFELGQGTEHMEHQR